MEEKLNKEALIEKIQKILNLAEGTNFGPEAELAKEKAAQLMASYAISMSEVLNFEKPDEVFVRVDVQGMTSKEHWEGTLAATISKAFDAEVVVSVSRGLKIGSFAQIAPSQTFNFVGTQSDLELTTHFFKFLRRAVGQMSAKKFSKMADKATYAFSMSVELGRRLEEIYNVRNSLSAQCRDLVVVKKNGVESFINKMFPDLKTSKVELTGSRESWLKGYEDAKKVPLNRPITDQSRKSAQIER